MPHLATKVACVETLGKIEMYRKRTIIVRLPSGCILINLCHINQSSLIKILIMGVLNNVAAPDFGDLSIRVRDLVPLIVLSLPNRLYIGRNEPIMNVM